jgi:hypothetical protein
MARFNNKPEVAEFEVIKNKRPVLQKNTAKKVDVTETPKAPEPKVAAKKRFRKMKMLNRNISFSRSAASVLDGSFLTRENLLRQIPFIIFITFLGIMYIANSYNAEKTIIEISRTKKQLEELRYEYITVKSNLVFQSKQSNVAYRLSNTQIKESTVPPIKLRNTGGRNE